MTAAITVVVPHLRQWRQLDDCVGSLRRQTLARECYDVIVVDNGSPDFEDQRKRLATLWPDVTFTSEAAAGPGPARNTGIAQAKTPLIACIDADCVADERWLECALEALRRDGPGTVHGGDVRVPLPDPENATGVEAFEVVFAFRQKMYITRKHFSVTADIAFWKQDFDQVGGFGDISVAEDKDWCLRARSLGLALRYEPGMIVHHPARRSMEQLRAKWTRLTAHMAEKARARRSLGPWAGTTAVALMLSIIPHLLIIWTTPRLRGISLRFEASKALFDIRFFRAAETLRHLRNAPSGAKSWNR